MLKNTIKKALFPATILVATAASFMVISATGTKVATTKDGVQTTNVTTLPLESLTYETTLKGFGEIVPAEITQLSTRVSGNVVYWSEKFVRGGIVKKGEVLFRLEDSRYQADLKNAEAAIFSAKAELERELGLAKVAKSELDRINAKERNSLFLREPQINSAYAAVSSAEALLISAKTNLASTEVRAPFDALVVERNLGLGQFVTEGAPVAVLYNVENAEIIVPIAKFDSQFLPDELAGRKVKLSLPNSNVSMIAELSRQLNLTDSLTRTNSVVVQVKDLYQSNGGTQSLQFGDYVEVTFAGKPVQDVFKVPEHLVSNNKVWVMNQQNMLERRDVAIVRNEQGFALVGSGFSQSDKLVTTVPEYPYQGMPVKVIVAQAPEGKERL